MEHDSKTWFQRNITGMVQVAGGLKPLAAISKELAKEFGGQGCVTATALRDWRDRPGAEEGSKVGKFARLFNLTRGELVEELPKKWWDEFEAKHGVKNNLKAKVIAFVSSADMSTITPEERAAMFLLAGNSPKSTEKAPAAKSPPKKRNRATKKAPARKAG